MALTLKKSQVMPALKTSSWQEIRFTNGLYLRPIDFTKSSTPLVLTSPPDQVVASGSLREIYPKIKHLTPCCSFCYWVTANPATTAMIDGYLVCDDCKAKVEPYYHCSICKAPLSLELARSSRNEFRTGICGLDSCRRKDDVQRGRLCCEEAEYIACVCARAYKCAKHAPNGVHFGSHD